MRIGSQVVHADKQVTSIDILFFFLLTCGHFIVPFIHLADLSFLLASWPSPDPDLLPCDSGRDPALADSFIS
jgi:hypothetical protein